MAFFFEDPDYGTEEIGNKMINRHFPMMVTEPFFDNRMVNRWSNLSRLTVETHAVKKFVVELDYKCDELSEYNCVKEVVAPPLTCGDRSELLRLIRSFFRLGVSWVCILTTLSKRKRGRLNVTDNAN